MFFIDPEITTAISITVISALILYIIYVVFKLNTKYKK